MTTPTSLLALALLGCPWSEPTEVVVHQEAAPTTTAAAASNPASISTVKAAEPAAAAPVLEMPLPPGRPTLRDCDGMLGSLLPSERRSGLSLLTLTGCANAPEPTAVPTSVEAEPPPLPEPSPAAAEGDLALEAPLADPVDAAPAEPVASRPPPPPPPRIPAQEGPARARPSKDDSRRHNDLSKEAEKKPAEQRLDDGLVADAPEDKFGDDDREERQKSEEPRAEKLKKLTPTYDWGGVVYLSNDDSMSLASAQRVLFALSRGVPLSPGEVRKHELLNYFSFDTATPPQGRTFSVLGSARRDGDQLSLALAVRGANPPRQPLDLTVVIDRSGSMAADGRMDYVRRGLRRMVEGLQRGDRIDVVLFDNDVCAPIEGLVIGRDPIDPLLKVIERVQPRGSTDLDAGLREAYRIQTDRSAGDVHGRNRHVLLVTDAELNTGNVDESLVSEVGRNLDEHGVKLSGIGVGRDFNDHMLDMLTEKGRGAYVYLGSEAVVDRIFGPGFDSLVRTVAHDVQFSLDLPDSLAMARFYGEESSSVAADVKPIHYHAGTTQLFLQDLAIHDGKLVESDPITMKIRFKDAISGEPMTEELRTTVGALLDADPHNVDKARALMAFSDWVLAGAMRADPCGDPLSAYLSRSSALRDDAEIGYVDGLVSSRCPNAVRPRPTVELRLKLDSDAPMRSAELQCGEIHSRIALSPSQSVVRFDASPGSCRLELRETSGELLPVDISVPQVSSDLRCMIRGGRASCG